MGIIQCKVKILYIKIMSIDKNEQICSLIETYENMLTAKQIEILHDYYFLDLSLSEIAENNGTTRQAVKDILDRAVKLCLNYEEKLNLHKKLMAEKENLNKILQLNDIDEIKKIVNDTISKLEV